MREREDKNRTREAGHLNEIQGIVANTLNLFPNGAVGFIDWLDARVAIAFASVELGIYQECEQNANSESSEVRFCVS